MMAFRQRARTDHEVLQHGVTRNERRNYTISHEICNFFRPLRTLSAEWVLSYGNRMTQEEIRRKLSVAKVGIAGLGGLGSNCAAALARAGVGTLVLADFDTVAESNLDRQYYFRDQVGMRKAHAMAENLRRIDPNTTLEVHAVRLNEELVVRLFRDCDVIVEAFDLAEAKKMIIETVLIRMPNTWLVAASGLAGFGRFESIRKIKSGRLILCGDGESEVGPDAPPLAPRVGLVACMEADAVLEILLGTEETNRTE